MRENWVIHNNYKPLEKELKDIITSFSNQGDIVMDGERNLIKKFKLSTGLTINIKSFKKPHLINQFLYQYVRLSKAERSYKHAVRLINSNIKTPFPIAYVEFSNLIGITNSYYISEHIEYDFTYRDSLYENFPDRENILRQFTHFTYQLHKNHINFLDHSPGNTLIVKKEHKLYDFYLVDLNRMAFKKMNLQDRILNFKKLATTKEVFHIMSDEYAKITNEPFDKIYTLMKDASDNFQEKYHRKRRFKERYLGKK
ncbi:MAG: lipopolysaccharide kinase [Flavobacteriales bacterium]